MALVALVGLAAVGRPGLVAAYAGRGSGPRCWSAGSIGWALAVLTWLAPGAVGWASEHVAGAGVVRDGARALVLCAPLLVVLVAEGVRVLAARAPRERVARAALAVGAVLLPVALLPGLALGVGHRVEPADYPAAYDEARQLLEERDGDVLVLPLSSYRAPVWNHRHLVLDPIGRYLTPRLRGERRAGRRRGAACRGRTRGSARRGRALAEPTPEERAAALGRIGIGAVVTDPTAPGDPPPESPARRSSTIPTCR